MRARSWVRRPWVPVVGGRAQVRSDTWMWDIYLSRGGKVVQVSPAHYRYVSWDAARNASRRWARMLGLELMQENVDHG